MSCAPLGANLAETLAPADGLRYGSAMRYDDNLTAERPHFVTHLECSGTGERHEAGEVHGLSRAGKPLLVRYDLDGVREVLTREALAARPHDMWRWRELLPVPDAVSITSLGEAATPLVPLPRFSAAHGAAPILVKDEARLPTGSFKARGLAMAVSMARHFGLGRLAMPTNGNAGAAMSAYAAAAGMEAFVFAPEDTPDINIRETAVQGARTFRVNGLINDCGRIVGEGKQAAGWFDISTLKEPYRVEGKKTMGLELAEQLGWDVPDVIFYPTGGGTGLIGMWKAFAELEAIGLIGSKRPRMVAVQAAGCAPIVRAFEAGADHAEPWADAHTAAAGIRVPAAIGDALILSAVRDSGGFATAVEEDDIFTTRDQVARDDGLLLCPETAATAVAWRMALEQGLVGRDERVVLFNCATGLKYPLPPAGTPIDRHAPVDYSSMTTA